MSDKKTIILKPVTAGPNDHSKDVAVPYSAFDKYTSTSVEDGNAPGAVKTVTVHVSPEGGGFVVSRGKVGG